MFITYVAFVVGADEITVLENLYIDSGESSWTLGSVVVPGVYFVLITLGHQILRRFHRLGMYIPSYYHTQFSGRFSLIGFIAQKKSFRPFAYLFNCSST